MNHRLIYLVLTAALVAAGACGDDDDDGQQDAQGGEDGGAGTSGGGSDGDEQDGGSGDGEAGAGGSVDPSLFGSENCPNGVLEKDLGEQCDDGDLNDRDGCTGLCEFTCRDDEDCDDLNICNGTEICKPDHTCSSGNQVEDGEFCGPDLSCWEGICVANACGDGRQQGDEQCDDGDADDTNGCTRLCRFTCEENADCRGGDQCAGADTCDTGSHICTGTALPDETVCTVVSSGKTGWCQNAVCVPTDCGNGTAEGTEECDLGDQNGVKGSGCSIDCETVRCGNHTMEGDEQCDDGGLEDWDGCNSSCRAELVHRMRELQILTEPAPEFCRYPGKNGLGEAFPGAVELPILGTINTVDFLNDSINSAYETGSVHPLTAILYSLDTSMQTSDSDIELALISGVQGEEEWVDGEPRLDYPYLVQAESFQDGKPVNSLKAAQTGGGYVVTREPSKLVVSSPLGGNFEMRELMFRTIFDLETLSKPEAPPELADGVLLPEEAGVGETDKDGVYRPAGTMCGVQPLSAMKSMPLFSGIEQFCCTAEGGTYRGCSEGVSPPDCDSLGDILLGGCNVCISLANSPIPNVECTPGCRGYLIVEPIKPDVDLDGDGKEDGFSTVMAFESIRVRTRGVTEQYQ